MRILHIVLSTFYSIVMTTISVLAIMLFLEEKTIWSGWGLVLWLIAGLLGFMPLLKYYIGVYYSHFVDKDQDEDNDSSSKLQTNE